MEIACKDTVSPHENQNFLLFVGNQEARRSEEQALRAEEMDHCAVEIPQVAVTEILRFGKGPLPPCVLERPAVPLPGEINPFGVAEFIPHEIEVAASGSRGGDQPDHLVERYSAIDDGVL